MFLIVSVKLFIDIIIQKNKKPLIGRREFDLTVTQLLISLGIFLEA